jgi:hypothetical protein
MKSEENVHISIAPNPTQGTVTISGFEATTTSFDLVISDLMGREIFRSNPTLESGRCTLDVKALSLSKGIYQIRLTSEEETSTHKLMVE